MSETTEFELVVPLTGVGPASVAFQDPPGGAYKVEIVGVKQVTKEEEGGKTNVHFQVIITEECDVKGFPTTIVQGTDWAKPFNAKLIHNLLSGMGFPSDKITGHLRLVPSNFIGKTAYMFVRPAPEGEVDEQGRKKWANKNFMTREEYEQVKRMAVLAAQVMRSGAAPANGPQTPVVRTVGAAPAPAPTHAPGPVPAPAPAGSAVVDLSSMFPSA